MIISWQDMRLKTFSQHSKRNKYNSILAIHNLRLRENKKTFLQKKDK